MRFIQYPAAGRPPTLTQELEELVVLTYGAIESTNVERWALAFGAAAPPPIPGTMRAHAYETDVVGAIHRLGQRYWERRGEAAVWERPFPTGAPGRPPAVDIALFDPGNHAETRVEFGIYSTNARGEPTRGKLADDSRKLYELRMEHQPGFHHVGNYIVLWHEYSGARTAMIERRRRIARQTMVEHGREVTATAAAYSVDLLMLSGGPLFPTAVNHHHWVAVGLFQVTAA